MEAVRKEVAVATVVATEEAKVAVVSAVTWEEAQAAVEVGTPLSQEEWTEESWEKVG